MDGDISGLGFRIDEAGDRLEVESGSLPLSKISHVIVNTDTNEHDAVAGAVVIQTVPDDVNLSIPSSTPNRYEFVFTGNDAADAQRMTAALDALSTELKHHGVGVTQTSVSQDLFHRTFAEVG